jgi:hypothetical protein
MGNEVVYGTNDPEVVMISHERTQAGGLNINFHTGTSTGLSLQPLTYSYYLRRASLSSVLQFNLMT